MSYFERALVVTILIGSLSGLTGVFVVLRRRVLFTQALTHVTFPGAVIATVLGANMQVGAVIACFALVLILTVLGQLRGQGSQAASGVLLTAGFALGVVLQALNPTIPVQIDSFLFGSILAVTWTDALFALGGFVLVLVGLLLWGKHILFFLFDRTGALASGISALWIDVALLLLTTITVVVSIPAAGAILAIALIAAPAAAARYLTDRIFVMLWLAPVLGALSGVLGLLVSRMWGYSAGASIALMAALSFTASWAWAQRRRTSATRSIIVRSHG